jgi:hypothetical protein
MNAASMLLLVLLSGLSGCMSALHGAALKGDAKTVAALLEEGEDANKPSSIPLDAPGWSPLLLAAGGGIGGTVTEGGGHLESVRLLVEKGGANVNLRSGPMGEAPLHPAARNGNLQIVRYLLDHGAEVNLKARPYHFGNVEDYTALHLAALMGHSQVVQLLLARGADPGIKTREGDRASTLAGNKGYPQIAKLLKQTEVTQGIAEEPALAKGAAPESALGPPSVPASDVDRLPAVKVTAKKHAYAVVIGIEQYREKLPKADFADRDAKLVGEYLTKVLGYPEENVVVRVNERATGKDLEKYFDNWLPNNVEKGGSVFVYYSGHGAPNPQTSDAYLVPYDGDPAFLDTTGYPLKRLYAALDKLPATNITVVLDSCFSGAGGRSVIAKGARPMVLSVENAVLAGGKTAVLAASSGAQISSTFEEQGHGLLTYFFLKGLQGEGDLNHDGTITLAELYEYVKPNVQRIARKQYNNEQQPQLLASPEALRKGGGRLVEAPTPSR